MIEVIKEKLGTNLVYIEQEKFNNEYVNSYVFEYKVNSSDKFTFISFDEVNTWLCTSDHFIGKTICARSLEDLLEKLIDEVGSLHN